MYIINTIPYVVIAKQYPLHMVLYNKI